MRNGGVQGFFKVAGFYPFTLSLFRFCFSVMFLPIDVKKTQILSGALVF
ncbi:hypothetical protein ISN45_Aa02g025220, partial [Arabidopsis thaliana x Arabidopsis arenosa]